jgi:hypothetical protein
MSTSYHLQGNDQLSPKNKAGSSKKGLKYNPRGRKLRSQVWPFSSKGKSVHFTSGQKKERERISRTQQQPSPNSQHPLISIMSASQLVDPILGLHLGGISPASNFSFTSHPSFLLSQPLPVLPEGVLIY